MATETKTMDIRMIPVKQYATPTTGSTINVSTNGYVKLRIVPAGSLLALTVSLPSSPQDGDVVEIACTQAITTFTMSNGTVNGALTTMAASTFAVYEYNSDSSQWIRVG